MMSDQVVQVGEKPDISALNIRLEQHRKQLQGDTVTPIVKGKVVRMVGLTLEVTGCHAAVGSRCHIESASGELIEAEVVGFGDGRLYLMAVGHVRGLTPGALVSPVQRTSEVSVGMSMLGRVVDGGGAVLDGGKALILEEHMPLLGESINPLRRSLITEPLDVGIRAINALLTIGRGQRMGLFAGSGVGKSTLLGLITRHTDADVIVVGLIGERGREVQEFIEEILGDEGMARSVVVAAPADDSPLMRLHGAWRATAIAEYFRDRGLNVLLLMDSLTRVAQAQREIALAIGEPPVTKGYPPSVFTRLPHLVERAGNVSGVGSITAIYTVLVEGDDLMDPIADAARAILDGHISLTRRIADSGRYPAIDIEGSVSRVTTRLLDPAQLALVRQFRELYSTYEHNQDLINIGAYTRGSDPQIDLAIAAYPQLQGFLQQGLIEKVDLKQSFSALQALSASMQVAS
jgi:flagellum-specific ATP synthase